MKRVVLNIHERQEEEDYQGFLFTSIVVKFFAIKPLK